MREYGEIPTTKWRLNFRIAAHRALRKLVFMRDNFTCRTCGDRPDESPDNYDGSYAPLLGGKSSYLVVDHVISQCRGIGHSHHPDNLQTLCASCNAKKRNSVDIKGAL